MTSLPIDFSIRPFDIERDLDGALHCFNEGFEHILWPSMRHASPSLHRDYVRFFFKLSTDCFVAEMNGDIAGILFGAAPVNITGLLRAIFFYLFHVIPKGLVNGYGMNRVAYRHFFRLIYGYLPFLILHPTPWPFCEVALFTSVRKYRGRGVGRGLMDHFVDTVRATGNTGTFVCTDTALSYRFYESYGFKLRKRFVQRAYKYAIPDRSFTARIYFYEIPG